MLQAYVIATTFGLAASLRLTSHEARKHDSLSELDQFLIDQILDDTNQGLAVSRRSSTTQSSGFLNGVKSFDVGSIEVVIFDTRKESRVDLPGVPGQHASNPGAGTPWVGMPGKTQSLKEAVAATAEKTEDKIMILADGGDVIYGGCSEKDLLDRYNLVVASSATAENATPSVVFGAELGVFPSYLLSNYSDFKSRQLHVLSMANISDDAYAPFADCRDYKSGPCSQPVSMQFVNGGFYMGPAKDLLRVLKSASGAVNDQEHNAHYMFEHPNECTLDYTGELVLNFHNFREEKEKHKVYNDPGLVVHIEETPSGQHTVENRVTGRTACFLHGNGNGIHVVGRIARELDILRGV